jgi:UDP-glucose-4-epimerase GalE
VSVLVTGGAGYIGSHAVKALRAAGRDVVIYDNLSAGHRAAAGAAGAPLEVGEIQDVARLREVMTAHRIEAVMHFAAWLSVGESVTQPIAYYENNVGGTLAVLEAMVESQVPYFIFSSTAATFGNPVETPITEAHPQRPINTYGETKLAVERALPHFERAYGVRSIALRYFNAAGADPDGMLGEDHRPEIHVIPRAIDAALGRDTFAIFGDDYETPDGTCLRDYVHVSDLAAAHLLALDSLRAGGESAAYNLGNGRPTSVREVVDAVERVTGRAVPLTLGPRRPGDPAVLYASSDRIRRTLGWAPRYEDIDVIVETAWRWREAHPRGYEDRGSGAEDRRPRAEDRRPKTGDRRSKGQGTEGQTPL